MKSYFCVRERVASRKANESTSRACTRMLGKAMAHGWLQLHSPDPERAPSSVLGPAEIYGGSMKPWAASSRRRDIRPGRSQISRPLSPNSPSSTPVTLLLCPVLLFTIVFNSNAYLTSCIVPPARSIRTLHTRRSCEENFDLYPV